MSPFLCWLLKNPTFPVVLVSAIIAGFGFLTTRHLTRSKNTIDFETAYHQSDDLTAAFKAVLEWSATSTWEGTGALANDPNHPLVPQIREILNTWERASIAVRRKVYDEDLLYNAYGTTVIFLWKQMTPYMRQRQAKNSRLYMNFDWLALRWIIRRGETTDSKNSKKLKAALKILNEIR